MNSVLSVQKGMRIGIRVILLLDDNKTYKSISEYLFLDEGSIANYRKRYIDGGLEGVILDEHCTKRTRLNDFNELHLISELERKFLSDKQDQEDFIKAYGKIKSSNGKICFASEVYFF